MATAHTLTARTADMAGRFEAEALPHLDELYRAARRYTRTPADAEDLVQDTMLRAYSGFATFQQGTNIRAWLHRILTNTWINRHRVRERRPDEWLTDVITDAQLAAEIGHGSLGGRSAEVEALELLPDADVQAALARLSEAQRLVVYLADVEGFRYKEIAAITGMPLGTVMSRLHRGRGHLRRMLSDLAGAHGYAVSA